MNLRAWLLLTLAWVAAWSEVGLRTLILGALLSLAALAFSGGLRQPPSLRLSPVPWGRLFVFFLAELVRGTYQVGKFIVLPGKRFRPGILEMALRLPSENSIVLLGALISLTPGVTLIGISCDKSRLYVHALDVTDLNAVRQSLLQMQSLVLGVLR